MKFKEEISRREEKSGKETPGDTPFVGTSIFQLPTSVFPLFAYRRNFRTSTQRLE
jgi:hypothetical protein